MKKIQANVGFMSPRWLINEAAPHGSYRGNQLSNVGNSYNERGGLTRRPGPSPEVTEMIKLLQRHVDPQQSHTLSPVHKKAIRDMIRSYKKLGGLRESDRDFSANPIDAEKIDQGSVVLHGKYYDEVYIESASWQDGTPLTADELNELNDSDAGYELSQEVYWNGDSPDTTA